MLGLATGPPGWNRTELLTRGTEVNLARDGVPGSDAIFPGREGPHGVGVLVFLVVLPIVVGQDTAVRRDFRHDAPAKAALLETLLHHLVADLLVVEGVLLDPVANARGANMALLVVRVVTEEAQCVGEHHGWCGAFDLE